MLREEQLSRIKRIHDFYMEEPVFKKHYGYTRVLRQKLSYMRAYINSVGTEHIGPAMTERNRRLLASRPYTTRLRRAYAEAAILNNMEPQIGEDELIVGRPDYTPLTPEETAEYRQLEIAMRGAPYTTLLTLGHMSLDYPKLLRVGVNGLIAEIRARMNGLELNLPENLSRYEFYEGALIELEGLLTLQRRYAEKCAEMIKTATGRRKEELYRMHEALCRIPAQPPRTFYEALQSIHFYNFNLWELYYFGRVDQYLYPFYKADIEAGRLTYEEAVEMFACFLLMPEAYIMPSVALDSMIGGCDAKGNPIENEVTFLALDAAELARAGNGKIALAISKKSSDRLLRRAIQVNAAGATQPALYNDDVITAGMIRAGVAPEDACYYANTGCVEMTPIGKSGMYPCAPYHNMAEIFLNTLRENQDAPDCDALIRAFEKQLRSEIFLANLEINRRQMERSRVGGEPLRVSCLVDDCIKRGMAIDEGGAVYNQIEPTFVGISNVVDSLAVLQTLVYDQKRYTVSQLLEIADKNYEGSEPLRQYILNRIPHYGTNDEMPDSYAKKITTMITEACKGITTYRHSILAPGTFTYIENVTLGRATQATLDGRLAGTPLAASSAASAGRETKGPTAALLSATSWDHTPYIGGIVINVKFTPGQMSGKNEDNMLTFVRAFLERGGLEMQFNCVSNDTLRAAQEHPEQYRDLLVRVSGFSAYFTKLPPDLQQEIIDRNEQSFE